MSRMIRVGAIAALCLAVNACGTAVESAARESPTSVTSVSASSAPASPPAAVSSAGVAATRTTSGPPPAPRTTAPRQGSTSAPVTVRFSHPLPLQQPNPGPFTGIFQEGCGDPSRALVTISIADPERRPLPEYDYHVQTPVPYRGTFTGLSMGNNGATWGGLLGPFPVDPANAAGGTIAVTVRVKYADGSSRTAGASTVFKPCRR